MIEPIVDEHSHRLALRRVEELWDAGPGSPQAQELDALATLIDAYERKHVPIAPPDAIAATEHDASSSAPGRQRPGELGRHD